MNSRLRLRPPKQTLAQRSGSAIKPIGLPSGLNTLTPSRSAWPMPQPHHKLPSTSTRKPSGVPSGSAVIKMRKPRAIVDHVVGIDVTRRRAAVLDIAFGFVGRELDAVRAAQRALHYGGSAGFGIEAIDVGRQFNRRNVALVVVQ